MKSDVLSLPENLTLSKLGVPSLRAPRVRVMLSLSEMLFAIIASSESYYYTIILLPLKPGDDS